MVKSVDTKNKVMASATKTVSAVECVACGSVHLVTAKDFVVFYGDVSIGLDVDEQTVILGNIDERGRVSGSTICCLKADCLEKTIGPIAQVLRNGFVSDSEGENVDFD